MKIKMLKTSASPAGVFETDKEYEVGETMDREEAEVLVEVGSAIVVETTQDIENDEIEAPIVGLKHLGGGWYLLPNGEKVQGKEEAEEALANLNG
ncbi:hypothetical protein [Bacillus sp. FJAT-18017]|uniref:hypothetical protein n=1 Tax=Bacillus sp. FJAT-18017 TaxID=1705566 RepID=UPI0006AE451E|nr:hypothetical protein [Bacillus sp. FJAT-18017]